MLRYARVKPALLQVEMHPYNAQHKLLRFAREKGVQTMAFSNLASASYVEIGMAQASDSLLEHASIKGPSLTLSAMPGCEQRVFVKDISSCQCSCRVFVPCA